MVAFQAKSILVSNPSALFSGYTVLNANGGSGKASVKLVAMAFGKLKVGNEKVKVAGKKFKIPGFTFNKKIANLVSMGIST